MCEMTERNSKNSKTINKRNKGKILCEDFSKNSRIVKETIGRGIHFWRRLLWCRKDSDFETTKKNPTAKSYLMLRHLDLHPK